MLFLIIEKSEDADLHTIIFHLANDNQMSYPFGACGVTFTVWQILYQFAESEDMKTFLNDILHMYGGIFLPRDS